MHLILNLFSIYPSPLFCQKKKHEVFKKNDERIFFEYLENMILFTQKGWEGIPLRNLLSSTSQKKLQLIEYLLDGSKTSLHDLAIKFSISMTATRNYLIEIANDFSFLDVQMDDFSFVQIQLRPFATLMDVYSYFLIHASAFQLLELLFSSNFTSYEMLALELNLSKSSIIRLIKKINLVLAPYDFFIATKPIQLKGNEKNIRQFFFGFFLREIPT